LWRDNEQREAVGLYPPVYLSSPYLEHDAVMVVLSNEERPALWEQVSNWLDRNGSIGNRELCRIAGNEAYESWRRHGTAKHDFIIRVRR
jgi:hypothetical protein